ncbi:hypothetical protein [Amycolatopsis taiwanensis]|uniref:Uncharacterized protein n=1 Tax=Amycolatopsis taiwanensis TaxID=342230 RepID=A0A9W6VGL5_9PSEU|nr:hypothetical protein [Amycolatopsis taiwanensis]GLY67880.1 hypothetical protein Atai01_44990 [Amycolatopsis taiwanensis]
MRTTSIAAVRAAWGCVLLTASRSVLRDQHELAKVVTALGLRHLAQSAVTLRHPAGFVARWAWTADLAHCLSMLVLAALSRRWRYPAVVNAAVAAIWAGATRNASRPDAPCPR